MAIEFEPGLLRIDRRTKANLPLPSTDSDFRKALLQASLDFPGSSAFMYRFNQAAWNYLQSLNYPLLFDLPKPERPPPDPHVEPIRCTELWLEAIGEGVLDLHDLKWRQFEELVEELFRRGGYDTRLGKGKKDGGVDIIGKRSLMGVGDLLFIIQVKHLTAGHKVGLGVIRELADTVRESKASKGIVVTSGALTRGALERIARDRHILGKLDVHDVREWIRNVLAAAV